MKFLLASTLLHFVAALPTPAALPRSCTTIVPKSLQPLDNSLPDVRYPQALFSGRSILMIMHNNVNGTSQNRSLQLVEFEVPHSSSACQLQISDPACSLSFTDSDDYQITAPVQLTVISLHPNSLPANRSYNDIFKAEPSIVSSWDFGDASMTPGDTNKIFNSERCPAAVDGVDGNGYLYYVLDYENVQDGFSEWMMVQQNADAEKGIDINGVYLTYC